NTSFHPHHHADNHPLMFSLLTSIAPPISPPPPSAADWPQWRGPARNGTSSETVGATWPADGPPVLWRASVGTGFSSFSISQGRVYTIGNANDQDTLWCFDAGTGKQIWKHTYDAKLGPQYYEGGPSSTPTVEADRLFTISKWGDVFCLDAA